MASKRSRDSHTAPVKVVFINTQYVETDAVSFKSVVQKLTGKDAVVGGGDDDISMARHTHSKPEIGRGMSFKDLDLILSELPPLDELMRLFPEYS